MPPKLSAQSARELLPGQTLRDHVVQGLELRARATIKAWQLYYRAKDGTQRRPKIGAFPALSIEAARDAARAILARVARGEDPSQVWRDQRTAPLVADLWDEYRARHLPRKKPRSRQEDERNYVNHIQPYLSKVRVADVSRDDINRVISRIQSAGSPVAANRVRALLSVMFNLAEGAEGLEWRPANSNPVAGATFIRERARRRKAEPQEIMAVLQAMSDLQESYPWQIAALRVMLYAGTRVTEILTAPRSAWKGNTILLREHKTDRTGIDREITLPSQAVAVLEALPIDRNGYLFGPLAVQKEPRHSTRQVWEKVRERAGCPDLRQQDLRRTFASVAISTGYSLSQIGELFSHASPSTTAGYAWMYRDARTEAAQSVADAITKESLHFAQPAKR